MNEDFVFFYHASFTPGPFPRLVSWTFYVIASEKENIQKAEKVVYWWH